MGILEPRADASERAERPATAKVTSRAESAVLQFFFTAKIISEYLLLLQILFGLMELSAINIGNAVGYDMTVKVISILMNSNYALVS